MLGPVAPINILVVKIPSDQMSHRVLLGGEKASLELETVNMLHSGLRNPLVPNRHTGILNVR